MEKEMMVQGAEAISLFCRLNIHAKKELPVRSSEMGLLILVEHSAEQVTPVMAANFFKVKKPMVTSMVNALLRQGYITKIPSAEDRRSYTLVPTQQGRQLVEKAYTEYFSTMEQLQNAMGSKQFNQMILLIEQANTILLEGKENG